MTVTLTDTDVGPFKRDPDRSAQLARVDGRCVHQTADYACEIYEDRPSLCRQFDCRRDPRIWVDFKKRIPRKP